jgi:hypothetical protein
MTKQRVLKKGNKSSMRERRKLKEMWSVILEDKKRCTICGKFVVCYFEAEGRITNYHMNYKRENEVYVLIPKRDFYICGNCNSDWSLFCASRDPKKLYESSKVLKKYYRLERYSRKEWKKKRKEFVVGDVILVE